MNFASRTWNFRLCLRPLRVVSFRQRHSLCALSSDGFPHVTQENDLDDPFEFEPLFPSDARTPWAARLVGRTGYPQASEERQPFIPYKGAHRSYTRYSNSLMRGIWSLDHDPIWLLVDDLIANGVPRDAAACPDFDEWEHIVGMRTLYEALSTLIAQGYLRDPYFAMDEFIEEDVEFDDHNVDSTSETKEPAVSEVPTWLIAYILVTMATSRSAAQEGLALCIAHLHQTPRHLQAPLLLLAMCSITKYKVTTQIPVILATFRDIFTAPPEDAEPRFQKIWESRNTVTYLHNILLILLAQFPRVPELASRTIRFMEHMETCNIRLENDAAERLLNSRFATQNLVRAVHDMLDRQRGESSEQPDNITKELARFYTARRDYHESPKYLELTRRIRPNKHLQMHIRAFKDATMALDRIRSDEEVEVRGIVDSSADQDIVQYNGGHKRNIYTSLLWSVSRDKSISSTTFLEMFWTIRGTYGDDRVIETVALSAMLKRQDWQQAKKLWAEWKTTNRSIQSILREMLRYLEKRDRIFGDADDVQNALKWSEATEVATMRRLIKLKVDAAALAVIVRALAGPKPDSLGYAFTTMNDHALKMRDYAKAATPLPDWNMITSRTREGRTSRVLKRELERDTDRPEDVLLTSRVINCFLYQANYFRRPDIVFRFWDGMTNYYGVDCTISTLVLVLRSARLAASMQISLTRWVPQWMRGSHNIFGGKGPVFTDFAEEILWMLDPRYRPNSMWNNEPPWRVARHLFREELMFANWPYLRKVQVPARAVRGDQATGRLDALQELQTRRRLWGTNVREIGKYPQLIPTSRVFMDYILLLGRVHRSSEIPEVLAWMRALEILPSSKLLSVSLALWSEVGLESLMDDSWNNTILEGQKRSLSTQLMHGGEYQKLISWLEDWLGAEAVPEERDIFNAFEYIRDLERKEGYLY